MYHQGEIKVRLTLSPLCWRGNLYFEAPNEQMWLPVQNVLVSSANKLSDHQNLWTC